MPATARPPRVIELDNPVRDYPWGSPTAIPAMLGQPADDRPVAELWIGAHPDSPSRWVEADSSGSNDADHPDGDGGSGSDGASLDALIATDPVGLLGPVAASRFDGRLPFLLKLLAADHALSVQVHPNRGQAQDGYAAEQAAGLALNSPLRTYRDPNHKPEMAYAITQFDAFSGFRPVARTVRLFDALDVPALTAYRDRLTGADGLREVFGSLLRLPERERDELIEHTLAGCRRVAAAGGDWADEAAATLLAADDHPGDIGAVVLLLLNYVRLDPGEAIFQVPGNVHAYLRGVCVELLAASDNVLRGGLTGKYIDVDELIRIADFVPTEQPRLQPSQGHDGLVRFQPPVPDFQLDVSEQPVTLAADRPHLVLAGEQPVRLREPVGEQLALAPWHAAFVAAGEGSCTAVPAGRVFVASVADRS